MLLSVIIPVFNEEATLAALVERVRDAPVPASVTLEIVLVDDASSDGTRDILARLAEQNPSLRIVYHDHNVGKGGALHSGFDAATGDLVLIQDADLEYDPQDYNRLLAPILDGRADVVIGTRFHGEARRALRPVQALANRVITVLSNIVTGRRLTDIECCYKVFRAELLHRITLREKRFGFEPEVVAKMVRLGARIEEIPVAYRGRTYADGKKIGLRDGFRAIWCIVRYRLRD
ncbi:MAG: glycosyltransferase family 2 protein [Phycisphaerales bacterium]|nr:glycosyltransferase family 2 protein [Phycisphaerales bacterium]